MDEVWHGKQPARSGRDSGTLLTECLALARAALYSRAEKRHLQDPENEDFKDDATQKRQVERFQEIMVRAAATVCISMVRAQACACYPWPTGRDRQGAAENHKGFDPR